jgi:hypothetical protein
LTYACSLRNWLISYDTDSKQCVRQQALFTSAFGTKNHVARARARSYWKTRSSATLKTCAMRQTTSSEGEYLLPSTRLRHAARRVPISRHTSPFEIWDVRVRAVKSPSEQIGCSPPDEVRVGCSSTVKYDALEAYRDVAGEKADACNHKPAASKNL